MYQKETKARVNLSIDHSVLSECKHKGFNISAMCEDYLKEILMTFEKAIDPKLCTHRWTWAFATSFGLAKECLKCRSIKRVYMDSDPDVFVNQPKF